MKTKTKSGTPGTTTVSTPTAVENKATPTLADLEAAFEQLYKSAFGVLIEIRDRNLFAPAFGSFREYGEARWRDSVRSMDAGDLAPFRPVIGPDRNAPKPPKVKKVKASEVASHKPVVVEPTTDENHLPKGQTLAQAVGLDPAPAPAAEPPAKPAKAKKPTQFQRTVKALDKSGMKRKPVRAQEQLDAKRLAGVATEIPGVNNLPALAVVA